MADVDRLELVSLMLGRNAADVRRHGTTAFGTERSASGTSIGTEHAAREGADDGAGATPVLRAQGLSARHRISDVSVQVHRGEVVGLGGLLGAGRSETAKAVVGALHTESGAVEVDGVPVRRNSTPAAIRAGAVMLPEDRKSEGIIPNLSVRENIVLAALPRISRAGLVDRAKQDEIVRYFIDRLRIRAASPEQRVSELSGGNQQKVMLARWLCLNPKVLLLDEPTRGIDVGAKAEVQGVIDELAADGLAVVLISSDLEELIEGSDRVVVLKDGSQVGELTGADVTEPALLAALAAAPPPAPGEQPPPAESAPGGGA
jgi:ribose transport system ATP-binding protein